MQSQQHVKEHRANGSIFFDLTDILEFARHHDRLSGISRTSLRILGYLVQKYGPDAVRLIAWHPTKLALFELDTDWCNEKYDFDRRAFCRDFDLDRRYVRTIDDWARTRYAGRPFRRRYHSIRARVLKALGNERFFRKRNIDLPHMVGNKLRPLILNPQDTVVIMGSPWDKERYTSLLREKIKEGLLLYVFVYDLIPFLFPEHVPDNIVGVFEKWFAESSTVATRIIAISESTKRDLSHLLLSRGLKKPMHVVPLAHQFLTPEPETPDGPRQAAHILSDARLPYVLCVGTIESRKNVWGLARVWARLIDDLGFDAPRLLLAGKQGWLKGDFDDLMRGTGNLGGHLRIVEAPSETELAYLYSNCLFTVYPSFYEGWGLPIGESLWFGKTCVTSRTSSMPEVGLDMCSYVDPTNLDELYGEVRRMIVDPAYRAQFEGKIRRERLRTWSEVAESLWATLTTARFEDISAREAQNPTGAPRTPIRAVLSASDASADL